MHYRQTLRKIRALFENYPLLLDYFEKGIQKPPKTKFRYHMRKILSRIFK